MLLFALASLVCAGAAAVPIPVILDTDIGDDIDDTWALMMLLGTREIDLKLIVTSTDDTQAKTRLVAKMLERVGRMDIPIGTGVKTSDRPINQAAWLGDYNYGHYNGPVYDDGVGRMIEVIKAAPGPVTICVIGPQTNLKAALERDPSLAEKARIVSMAGSIHIGYDGKEGRQPEYNVYRDVAAARAVFAAPWPVTIAPLDICGTLRLAGERYAQVVNEKRPGAMVTIENYDRWTNRGQHAKDSSSVLFDTAAIYLISDESLIEMETIKLSIDDRGNTVPDKNGRPVSCALRWKDRDAFEQRLVSALIGE
jgi:inosine-uridine nucleoside N-ribohydrolase